MAIIARDLIGTIPRRSLRICAIVAVMFLAVFSASVPTPMALVLPHIAVSLAIAVTATYVLPLTVFTMRARLAQLRDGQSVETFLQSDKYQALKDDFVETYYYSTF